MLERLWSGGWSMPSTASELAARLVAEIAVPLQAEQRAVPVADVAACEDWARSGARELTGFADAPALSAPGAPATAVRAALAVLAAYTGAQLPGVEVLSERAALAGFTRNAPYSAGGAFRALQAADGWLGLSLSRESDIELIPALVEGEIGGDPWAAASQWLRGRLLAPAAERTRLLGLPAAPIPVLPPPERRAPVLVSVGGVRTFVEKPFVLDLTSLWAGPLCARLLGLTGARIVKVESATRPDGARTGSPAFFERMHAGHELLTLDFTSQRDELCSMIRRADVVLEASRPRALRQLGIDAHAEASAGTIWASITAYGRDGDDAMRVGFGDDVAAGAGLVAWVNGTPVPVGDAIADPLAGVHAAAAVAIALRGRHGALLDVSMHDVAVRATRA